MHTVQRKLSNKCRTRFGVEPGLVWENLQVSIFGWSIRTSLCALKQPLLITFVIGTRQAVLQSTIDCTYRSRVVPGIASHSMKLPLTCFTDGQPHNALLH